MVILFLIVFVGLVGFGLILPLFPFYALRLGASPEVMTWTMAAFSLGQFIAAPIWGRLSDAWGRRPILIVTMLGSAISYLILAYADELWVLIFSRVFGGLMAGNIAIAFAYVTDITRPQDRAAGLGRISAALGLGFMFGPAIGGLLAGPDVETANYLLPALAAGGVSLIAMLGACLMLPESLPAERRRPLFGGRIESEQQGSAGAGPTGLLQRPNLLRLVTSAFMFFVAMSLMESIFPLWSNKLFNLGPSDIGWLFLGIGAISVIVQGVLIGKLVPRFGEKRLALFAVVMFGTGMLALATAGAIWQVLLGVAFFATGTGFLNPSLSSLVSQTAADNERGSVMGRYQAASALGRIGGPSISGMLYADVSFAAPFALGGLIMLPVLMLIRSTQIMTRPVSKPGALG